MASPGLSWSKFACGCNFFCIEVRNDQMTTWQRNEAFSKGTIQVHSLGGSNEMFISQLRFWAQTPAVERVSTWRSGFPMVSQHSGSRLVNSCRPAFLNTCVPPLVFHVMGTQHTPHPTKHCFDTFVQKGKNEIFGKVLMLPLSANSENGSNRNAIILSWHGCFVILESKGSCAYRCQQEKCQKKTHEHVHSLTSRVTPILGAPWKIDPAERCRSKSMSRVAMV